MPVCMAADIAFNVHVYVARHTHDMFLDLVLSIAAIRLSINMFHHRIGMSLQCNAQTRCTFFYFETHVVSLIRVHFAIDLQFASNGLVTRVFLNACL